MNRPDRAIGIVDAEIRRVVAAAVKPRRVVASPQPATSGGDAVAVWLHAVLDTPDFSGGTFGATLEYLIAPPLLERGGADMEALDLIDGALGHEPLELVTDAGTMSVAVIRRNLNLEDTATLWSLTEAPFRVSLAYEVRVVVRGGAAR
jgi:hypothetical protein